VQGLRAKHQIDERRPRGDAVPFLAGDAAADTDDHVRPLLLEQPPLAQQRKDLFLSLLAY
jgi:hypothetical protein